MLKTLDARSLPWEAEEMAVWLTDGNPTLGWRGDPRLSLQYSVLTAGRSGFDPRVGGYVRKGDAVAHCYEVIRHCEDGVDRRIKQVGVDRLVDLIPALISQDPRTPGQLPLIDRVMAENDAADRAAAQRIAEAKGEMTEHFWKLVADRENGRQTHRQVGGFDERSDRNLAK
jgi:hypothetical protein